jgi:hypothetical protein
MFILLSIMLLILFGCGQTGKDNGKNKNSKKEGPKNLLYSLEVWSLAENDVHSYHLRWPGDYYAFSKEDGGRCRLFDLENAKERSEITEEELNYFVEYVSNVQPQLWQEGSVDSYRIALFYYDENGEDRYVSVLGYDTFPEGFEEFIEKCNEIAGGNYLYTGEKVQELSPEFLTEVFGVTDEDVRNGNLQDVIDTLELNMYEVTKGFSMSDKLEAYYASTKEEELAPFRPVELYQVESTQEEYDDFVAVYLEQLGEGWVEIEESGQNHLRYFRNGEENRYFYIGRTMDLEELNVQRPAEEGEQYALVLDAHMEGMVFSMGFVYSSDKKFILLYDKNDPDMLIPFVELELEDR